MRTVSNALKVKVVLGREGPVRVGRLRGGCESSSAAAVRPGVPFYRIPSLVASSASLPLLFNFLFLLSVVSSCATFCSFFFQQFRLSLIGPNMLMRANHLWNVLFLCVPVHLFCYRTIHSTPFSPFLPEKMTHSF